MVSEPEFLILYTTTIQHLSSLLGEIFTKASPREAGPLEERLLQVLHRHRDGLYAERAQEFAILRPLTQQLQRIANHDKELLEIFKRGLLSSREDDYLGTSVEVNIASTLIQNRIRFQKSESPDFTITFQGTTVFLECTSVHLTQKREKDTRYKISSAVNSKAAKPYCNRATALCVDITNVNFLSLDTAYPLGIDGALREYTEGALGQTAFGSVVLLNYVFDFGLDVFASAYVRVDNRHSDHALARMLDRVFPVGEYRPYYHKFVPSG